MLSTEESLVPRSRKKKNSQKASRLPAQGDSINKLQELGAHQFQVVQKSSKRGFLNDNPAVIFQQQDKSTSDSMADSSPSSGNDYRTLRRKYLLLEEESCGLNKDLQDIEDEIKILEEEKLALLDELVVLEGLVDPSEMVPHSQPLK